MVIGHGEEAGRARAEHQRRHRDECVGGIESPPSRNQVIRVPKLRPPRPHCARSLTFTPAHLGGVETKTGGGEEKNEKDGQRDGIGAHFLFFSS